VIGGYGLFGVIVEADLDLVPNRMYELRQSTVAVEALPSHLHDDVFTDPTARLAYAHLSTSPASLLSEAIVYTHHDIAGCPDGEPMPPLRSDQDSRFGRLVLNLEGFAVEDTLRPDRIVIGTRNERSLTILKHVYATPLASGTPLLVTDLETAELVKTAANAFLATKISFINAMAEMCEATGADVRDLADAIGHDARIGRKFLGAGVGFGGGCLPKDIRAFRARADELGLSGTLTFLTEVDRINMRRRDRVITLAEQALDGSLCGRRIAILGAAFKPDSDDVRDSPGLDVAARLHDCGADVRVYDPMANGTAARVHPTLGYVESARAAISDAELVIVVTEWREFIDLNPSTANSWAAQPLVIDARNCLDADAWTDAGWTYMGLGRCHPAHNADPVVAHVPDNAAELADGHLVG
jgi:UDPglucose 6-dehydrogenase